MCPQQSATSRHMSQAYKVTCVSAVQGSRCPYAGALMLSKVPTQHATQVRAPTINDVLLMMPASSLDSSRAVTQSLVTVGL